MIKLSDPADLNDGERLIAKISSKANIVCSIDVDTMEKTNAYI
ncbi:hypothetical protein VSA01S_16100 [Vibrio sagamiensis NBRC 104589]|uniref:Uncharacterized protein n=1 Tax=Vibrio sagamiensis NBRC 104589 TaxID=1219064 RepID=A0A511QDW9_9VIBR|nr:hypothetical protein VSA01S_16100 [Vibrio sagamiensis NBRC 104589]